jgi:hypothetical protein
MGGERPADPVVDVGYALQVRESTSRPR